MKKASSELLLLDVNVLLSLAWPNHQFHVAARRRLASSRERWATCALTQLGFIRLSSNPVAIPTATTPAEAAALLAVMVEDPLHVYIETLPSPSAKETAGMLGSIAGSSQVTDVYLISIARLHHATFVTFDTKLTHAAGPDIAIEVLGR